MKNATKIAAAYEKSILKNHYSDIQAAMAACAKRGDGNYRVTCDDTQNSTHEIEVRNGVAEYC